MLAFVWMRVDGEAPERIAALSTGIFWLVLPSLVLFVVFPLLLRAGVNFWASLALACGATALAYVGLVAVLDRLDVQL